jgi:TonB-linked SusC/RagA family outer membrane protein
MEPGRLARRAPPDPYPSLAMRNSSSTPIARRVPSSRGRCMFVLLVALLAFAAGADAQEGTVAGTVVKAGTLTPVEGAQVQVQGTSIGAATDAAGRFRITGLSGDQVTLEIRRVSFQRVTQSVRVGDLAVRVVLNEAPVELDAVVVTGTAIGERRRAIGNAVATIDAAQELERSAAPNLGTLLQSRAPGVIVVPNTGRIGAGPTIWIRGRSTLSLSNEPIVYIDGVRVNNAVNQGPPGAGAGAFGAQNSEIASRLNDISPEDIESIEIIKGPAAATIYGTEAANGVIQIITKKGIAGQARWTARMEQGAQWFRDPEGRIPVNYSRDTVSGSPTFGQIVPWNPIQQERDRGTPIFHTGRTQSYQVALSGGRELLTYYLSGTYNDEEGIEPNNSGQNFSGHASLNVSPSSKVDIATSLHFLRSTAHLGADAGLSSMLGIALGHPMVNPTRRGFAFAPPEVPQQLYDNAQDINRFTGGATVSHRPASWFAHRLTFGLDYTADDSRALERYAPPELRPFVVAFAGAAGADGRIAQTLRNHSYITGDYSSTATFALTPSLSSASSIGGQFLRKQLKSSGLSGTQFPAPGVETVSGTTVVGTPTQSLTVNTTVGVYGQQQFGWNDRLFLTAGLRVDNNSAFGDEFDWVTYPKVGASWVISEESFWGGGLRTIINALKLRAAYGESGQQPNAFVALRTVVNAPRANGTPGVTPGSLGNPDLKPERGKEFEVGFEAGLLDRLSLDFTYYTKRTEDAILTRSLAPSGGFAGDQTVNIGETSNRGVELQAQFRAITLERFSWEIGGNISTNKDRIEDMGEIPSGAATLRNVEGYPIQGFWTKRIASATRNPDNSIDTASIRCVAGPSGGTPVRCNQALPVFIGTQTPKVTGAVTNTFSIGSRLTLYGLVDFKRGHKILNANDANRCAATIKVCEAQHFPERYSTAYLAAIAPSSATAGVLEPFIEDASFVKLREISASYRLPELWVSRAGVSSATLTIAGRNLATWADYAGIDPEVRYQGTVPQDQGLVPALTQFVVSLNLGF